MQKFQSNLKEQKFRLHLSALLLMLIPPIAMFFAAQSGAISLIWLLVAVGVLGNLIVILVP
jgi:hypothetical protein